MKKLFLALLLVCSLIQPCYAQSGLVSDKIINGATVNVTAGENLTANDVVSLINESGSMKAYKNTVSATANATPNGSEYTFNSASTAYCSAVALDSNRIFVSFTDTNQRVRATVGTISGTSITFGTPSNILYDSISTYTTSCKIDTDKILVMYGSNGISGIGMNILTITNNNEIAVGNETDVDNRGYATNYLTSTLIESNKVLLCYRDGSNGRAYAKLISISGSTATPYPSASSVGTSLNVTSDASYLSCCTLTSSLAIVTFRDVADGGYGSSQTLSISGTTITANSEHTFNQSGTTWLSADKLTDSSAVVVFVASGAAYAKILSVAGTSISSGDGNLVSNTGSESATACKAIGQNKILIACSLVASGITRFGTVAGTSITFESSINLSSSSINYTTLTKVGSNKVAVAFQTPNASSYGKAVINVPFANSYNSVRGLCTATTSSGSSAPILLQGRATGFSNLIVGSPYFLQSDFTIGTTPIALTNALYTYQSLSKEIYVGTALSDTELDFKVNYK